MIRACNVCGEYNDHKSWKSTTCNTCLLNGLKWCSACEQTQPINEFHKNGHTIRSFCKPCENRRSGKRTYTDKQKARRIKQSTASKRRRYATDATYRDKEKQRSRLREANKREAGYHSFAEWLLSLAYFDNSCAYCGDKRNLTKDHVVPLNDDGSNEIRNIVPACRRCNSSKQDLEIVTWYTSQKYYCEERLDNIITYLVEGR